MLHISLIVSALAIFLAHFLHRQLAVGNWPLAIGNRQPPVPLAMPGFDIAWPLARVLACESYANRSSGHQA